MPLSATPNMGLAEPTPGADSGTWDDELNSIITTIDSHDHSSGKGVRITPAGISINADLSFATNSATHLKTADFDLVTAPTSGARRFYWNSSDGELYVRDSNGIAIKLTNSGSINISLLGGIGGDYSSVGALLSYDDATRRYLLQQEGSPRAWAGVATGDIDLYEKAVSITNKVTIKSPSALAASYALTMPAALPAATRPLQVSSAGVVSAPDNVDLGSGTLTTTGIVTVGTLKFTTARSYVIPAADGEIVSGGHSRTLSSAPGASTAQIAWTLASDAHQITFPVPCSFGDTITGYRAYVEKLSNAGTTLTAQLYKFDSTTTVETAVGAAVTLSTNAPGVTLMSSVALSHVVVATAQYYVAFGNAAGTANDLVYHVVVDYVRT